jgi:hypothetical protein
MMATSIAIMVMPQTGAAGTHTNVDGSSLAAFHPIGVMPSHPPRASNRNVTDDIDGREAL